jgi:hypothetical protein
MHGIQGTVNTRITFYVAQNGECLWQFSDYYTFQEIYATRNKN